MGGFGSGHGSGGKREGAGRPKRATPAPPRKFIHFQASDHEIETFKRRAGAAGLSVSEYIKIQCISGE